MSKKSFPNPLNSSLFKKEPMYGINQFVTNQEVVETLEKMGSMPLKEDSHLYPVFGAISIIEGSKKNAEGYGADSGRGPAISLLDVILSANRSYNNFVRPRLETIKYNLPRLSTFGELEIILNNNTKEEFFKLRDLKDHKKYQVLTDMIQAIRILKEQYGISDDYEVMNHRANHIDITKYTQNPIGSIKNVALATIQHLRMNFGVRTVKPDQRVKEVLKNEFGVKTNDNAKCIVYAEEIAEITGHEVLIIDQIFVNYGSGYYRR